MNYCCHLKTDEQKFGILDTIIVKCPDKLKDIFKTIPESYYNPSENKESNQQVVEQLLNKNLQHVFSDKKEYIEVVIKTIIKAYYSDSMSLIVASNIIKFFIDRNLIDINTIVWNYEGKEVTTAAAAYVMGKEDLAKYLYSLPGYLDNDKLIKDTSDMVIAGHIITSHYPYEIEKFINQPNYTNDKEKFFCVMEMIDERIKYDSENKSSCTIDAESIMNILLKKTKKEDYKAIQKEFAAKKTNEQLLQAKRQQLTATLANLNNYLLENEPAKKKIKEVEFNKQ